MTKRRLTRIFVSAALVLLTAAPLVAQPRHQPTSQPPGNRVQAPTPQPQTSPPPRQAVPRSPQADRQPQREPQRQPQAGDGHHGDFFPYYYPYYRWYPWGWWGGWGGWGYPYGPYYPWGMGAYWYGEQVRPDMGALDLDIRPEEAQVYLDGHMIGIADNFDGWPRHLWLEEGTYDLVFFLEGFETIARQYTIYPGLVIDVEDRMVQGEAVLPEDLLAKSSANREERLRRRLERGEEVGAAPDWQDRVRQEREGMADEDAYDARSEPARLRLSVTPADAAVYLDGRFLGTGEELGQVSAGLIVDAGPHELEVTRPGYEPKTTTFEAEAGEEVELTVELEAD